MSELRNKLDVTIMEFNDKSNDPSKYNETLKKICTISTKEELSYFLHHLVAFNSSPSFNINIFKSGISASWEDKANIDGCSYSIQIKIDHANAIFERVLCYFAFTGFKKFECNGISANIRKNYLKFTIWSANLPLVTEGSDVLEEIKTAFGFSEDAEFVYKNHKSLLQRVESSSSSVKNE